MGRDKGDVLSPTFWAAVFNILLTALDIDEESIGGTWVHSSANEGYKGSGTANASNLLSTTPAAEQLQPKADIVSAFSSIMGLQISTTKPRRFVVEAHGIDSEDIRGSTTVYT